MKTIIIAKCWRCEIEISIDTLDNRYSLCYDCAMDKVMA
jgi:hypothetical protein